MTPQLHTATGVEQRREQRRPGSGAVVVRWTNSRAFEVTGRLVDVSDGGFRMAHDCVSLTAGLFVEFSHQEAKGQARVVWTRILAGAVESGFVVSA